RTPPSWRALIPRHVGASPKLPGGTTSSFHLRAPLLVNGGEESLRAGGAAQRECQRRQIVIGDGRDFHVELIQADEVRREPRVIGTDGRRAAELHLDGVRELVRLLHN